MVFLLVLVCLLFLAWFNSMEYDEYDCIGIGFEIFFRLVYYSSIAAIQDRYTDSTPYSLHMPKIYLS